MRSGLLERIRVPTMLGIMAVRWHRLLLALLLALAPALGLLVAVWLGPDELRAAVTDTRNVHDTFARFISGVATASSIAVSVAALTMRRDLAGIRRHEERQEVNEEFRARVRERLEKKDVPIRLGPFLRALLGGIEAHARAAREALAGAGATVETESVDVATYLRDLEERAAATAKNVEPCEHRPDDLLLAILEFEQEVTTRMALRFARDERLPEGARERLRTLHEDLVDLGLAQNFLKTLDTQWGLSRMSTAILLSTLPSLVAAALMVLAYGRGAVDALGVMGAVALVCGALALVLFPLACFVSYVLRFIVLNQHTLPTDGFLLGPEARSS